MSNSAVKHNQSSRWRALNACRRCRHRKVKCSGTAPCHNCSSRRQSCIFDETDRKIVISERHLRDLERRARNSHNHFPDETNQLHQTDPMRPDERLYDNSDVHVVGEEGHEQGQNSVATPRLEQSHPEPNNRATLELDERSQLEAKKGVLPRHAFTWDFSQEIRQLLGASPSRQLSPSNSGSNTTYTILRQDAAPYDSSVPGLPHRDHIAYLAQVVDYHLNVNHRFLHLPTFLKQLEETSQQSMPISPIWRAKLWMVVALGKLFLENGATVSGPPGAAEFLESTRALPSQVVLDENPIMAIETLCLLALYAQSADLHRIAYLYISQANRMGHAWKLDDNHNHNHIAELEFAGENHIESLWCTVRILEQRSSATIGVVSDYNIHKQQYGSNQFGGLPNHNSAALQFNLSISNMLVRIVAVFSKHQSEDIMNPSMIGKIILELKSMQCIGQEMSKKLSFCDGPSISTVSRPIATLHLHYYHCIMIATKPILIYLVKSHLVEHNSPVHDDALVEILPKFVRTNANAAIHTLNIISILREQNLLETFTFFNSEVIFLAALCVILTKTIIPDVTDMSFVSTVKEILQNTGHKGSIPATALKAELEDIYKLISNKQLRPTSAETHGLCSNTNLPTSTTMIRDGRILNNALSGVIEIPHSFSTHLEGCVGVSDPLTINRSVPAGTCMEKSSTTARHEEHLLLTPGGRPSPLNEMHIDGLELDGMESSMSFDMADLQWLESVQ